MVELLGGAALGAAIGVVGAVLLAFTRRTGWSSPGFRPLAILALALFAYSVSVVAGANGFIAAFVGGMAFGAVDQHNDEAALRFTEEGGTLLSLLVWFIFGAVMLVPGLEGVGWRDVVFALLALTVLRMGARRPRRSRGRGSTASPCSSWAGSGPAAWPRWSSASSPSTPWRPSSPRPSWPPSPLTVALSVLLHGVSASPLAPRYGAYAARLGRSEHPSAPVRGPSTLHRAVRRSATVADRAARRRGTRRAPAMLTAELRNRIATNDWAPSTEI